MITAPFWTGSGLGNQLFRYVMCRTIALDKGYDFGMEFPHNFKGASFLKLDMGKPVTGGLYYQEGKPPLKLPDGIERFYEERKIIDHQELSIAYDHRVRKVSDHTRIDGEFQGERYWGHRRKEIDQWLTVEPLELAHDLCIINFRGGEYKYVPRLYLTKDYWDTAIAKMRQGVPGVRFEVVTDDIFEAYKFFPDFDITHDMALDWRKIRYAKNLILSNSSFAILPAWLNQNAYIIAPKFWARRNLGFWHCKYNKYSNFTYV